MTELIEFLTSKEIIMVYIVALVACALYFVIHYIDKFYYKRKQRQNTKELNKLVEDINYELAKERDLESNATMPEEVIEEAVYVEPVLEMIEPETAVEKELEEKLEKVVELLTINEEIEVETNSTEVNNIELSNIEVDNIEVNNVEIMPEVVNDIVEEEVQTIELNSEEVIEEIEETLDYTSAEPDQTEAEAELRRLTEALEQAEEETRNIDLTSYEEMQEKEAIISLEELLKKSKEMYESNELTQYADEGNEPISLADLERKVQESLEVETLMEPEEVIEVKEQVVESLELEEPEIIATGPKTLTLDDFFSIKTELPKETNLVYQEYKSTPVISPIYGIAKPVTQTELELENTANYDKLDEEIKKTNEFLMTLKELQSNLE